jgi:hypothetical protein
MPRGGPPCGERANLAMFDGAEFGKAIAAHPGEIEAALAAFEGARCFRAVRSRTRT